MARKPNYRFDRMERDRAKAVKKAERLKARQERSDTGGPGDATPDDAAENDASVVDQQSGTNEE